jgi:hypothetical protein
MEGDSYVIVAKKRGRTHANAPLTCLACLRFAPATAKLSSMSALDSDVIRGLFLQAWLESQPATATADEEGGFVLRDEDGSLTVERWLCGMQNQIWVPAHAGGKRGQRLIVATFHTHPNSGPEYQQEPSLTDIRGVRDDPDLNHPQYEGEYVISLESIYLIRKNGQVERVAETKTALGSV